MGNLEQLEAKLQEAERELAELELNAKRFNERQMVQKIFLNSVYGYMGNKIAPMGDDDIASSVTLTGQAVIKQSNEIMKEFIKEQLRDISDDAAERCIIYNDTDSCYISLKPICDRYNNFLDGGGNVTQECYDLIQKLEDRLNEDIVIWAKKELNSKDCRLVFKREAISDIGVFLAKKRYILHLLDEEGVKEPKFKYVGHEVVRTSMPTFIKPHAKKIIETMLMTRNLTATNKVLQQVYEDFKQLPIEKLAFVTGIHNLDKYSQQCNGTHLIKGMPVHAKSAYLYNYLINELDISQIHESINSGDKVRWLYVEKPNKYNLDTIGFKYSFPKEFAQLFKPDYNKIFDKILFQSIERLYDAVNWQIRKPAEAPKVELLDIFG